MIYLDYNSSTPVDPTVLNAITPFFKENFGNPSSQGHTWGWTADSAVQKSRTQIAKLLNCDPKEIFFTSGATESNNWALFGTFHHFLKNKEKIHIISCPIEHNSVLNTIKYLETLGAEVDWIQPNEEGIVEAKEVEKKIKPHTRLISLMWVNNEIGSINPIHEIAELAHKNKIYFHSDGTQAVGKLPVDLQSDKIDMMSFSGHKIYGPKGIGVLFKRKKDPYVQIDPFMIGGGQESGERSGTLNVPGIVGIGEACQMISSHFEAEVQHYKNLSKLLLNSLKEVFPDLKLNGPSLEKRSPMNLSITFPQDCGTDLSSRLIGLGVSSGSACSTGKIASSHVLKGIGLTPDQAARTLRISIGRMTTEADIIKAVSIFKTLKK
jgi:cysteine desulfurase